MEDHWFDELNKALVQNQPRRSLLGAAALLASVGLAPPLSAAAKKGKKRKGKGKGNQKGKGKGRGEDKKSKVTPRLCDPAIYTLCDAGPNFVSGEPARCEDTCDRCQREGSAFCLVPAGESDFPRQPTCCDYADECCGDGPVGECCTSDRCCEGVGGDPPFCAPPGQYCCRNGLGGSCPYGQTCCGGYCVACAAPEVLNPATCACELPDDGCGGTCVGPGLACCDGICRDTNQDENFCGGCDAPPCDRSIGELCCDGACVDTLFNDAHCYYNQPTCAPCPADQPQCCFGHCINPATTSCCRDAPNALSGVCGFPNAACCPYTFGTDTRTGCCNGTCCTLPNGAQGCCP